jgi:hypothetical protein
MSFNISIFFSGNRTEDLVGPCFNISNDDVYKKEETYEVSKLGNKPCKQRHEF